MVHKVSRRQVLQAGALAAVAAIAAPLNLISRLSGLVGGSSRHLLRSSYLPLVGHSFRVVQQSGAKVPMTLVDVRDLARPRRSGEDAFALWFEGPAAPFAQHPSLTVEQAQLGRFQLALMPVGRATERQDYEAIVNRPSR